MQSNVADKTKNVIRVKGPYRILNYSLTGRPIFIAHYQFKKLMSAAGGRLPLAGVPASIDIDLEVKFDVTALWRDKEALEKVSDLTDYPIKGLAPGIIYVKEVRSTFLFYGNVWFHLDQSVRNTEEPSEDEDGQLRFKNSIQQMEKSTTGLGLKRPTVSYKPAYKPTVSTTYKPKGDCLYGF